MNSELAKKHCEPCRGGVSPLRGDAIETLHAQLGAGWEVAEEHHLVKSFRFDDFRGALAYTNRVGEIAEQEGHHPDIRLAWGEVVLTIWTHKINGLTESDFILAAKADEVLAG